VTKPPLERRVHRRVQLDREVAIDLADASFSGRSLNVSVGGMALELACASPRELTVGVRVTVRVDLGAGAFALTTGEIMRVARGVLGLRFVALDRTSLLALLACVERHTSSGSEPAPSDRLEKAELS
jgi:predicted acyl esterase